MPLREKEVHILNNFVVKFLSSCEAQSCIPVWKSELVQNELKNLVGKDIRSDRLGAPLNAYQQFAHDYRPKLRETHPHLKFVEVSKELSQMWKSLPLDNIEKYTYYVNKANEDREKWKTNKTSVNSKALNLVKSLNQTEQYTEIKPKNVSWEDEDPAYENFEEYQIQRMMEKYPDKDPERYLDAIKEKWRVMPHEKRQRYLHIK